MIGYHESKPTPSLYECIVLPTLQQQRPVPQQMQSLAEENKNNNSLSLIILGVMMPDMDGFQVLKKIRETSNIPVLMLTARSHAEDKVSGLRLSADHYLTKPFSISELMARVNSLIRRYTK